MTGRETYPVGLTIMALAFALGLFGFMQSPYFHIADVVIEGNVVVADSTVSALAQVHSGDNLLNVDMRATAERVATHPRIRHVNVDRKLPDTLYVHVSEHVPVALVVHGEERFALTSDGIVVPLAPGEEEGLPVVTEEDEGKLSLAVAAAGHVPPSLRQRLESVYVGGDGETDIRLTTRDGVVILFGDGDQLARKATIAASLLESSDYAFVDVRFPRSPAVRRR